MTAVNANPLINSNPSDTIDAVRVYLRFLCQNAESSEDEGMRLSLLVALGALDSLSSHGGGEKSFAQSV